MVRRRRRSSNHRAKKQRSNGPVIPASDGPAPSQHQPEPEGSETEDLNQSGSHTRLLSDRPSTQLPKRLIERKDVSDADYTLASSLGVGSIATVHIAFQHGLQRPVALKRLIPARIDDQEALDLFITEAKILSVIDHPGVPEVYEIGRDQDDLPFFTMRLINGHDWGSSINKNSIETDLTILCTIIDIVQEAHSLRILHRDLKPENVMVNSSGQVFLIDWGLAGSSSDSSVARPISRYSARSGTIHYMAPEVARGEVKWIGIESEIYQIGAILFHILTGSPPHCDVNDSDRYERAPTATNEFCTSHTSLIELAIQCLHPNPIDRPDSLDAVQRVIQQTL